MELRNDEVFLSKPAVIAGPGDPCPTCNRRLPIPKEDRTPRKRQQFNIAVPVKDKNGNTIENGKEILDGLIEAARQNLIPVMGWDKDVPPYFVLTAVLADWLNT